MKDNNQENAGNSRNMINALDPWLPPSIRDSASLSLEDLIRSRVLVCILLSSTLAALFALLLCIILDVVTRFSFINPIIIAAICFIIVLLDYLFFYKTGKLDASAILYSLSLFVACIVSVILTGGYQSPVKQVLICCPVISFLISGRQEGIYNAALIYVVGLALLVLDSMGFDMLQIMPNEILPYLSGAIWLITIVMIVVCLYVYDLLLEDKRSIRANDK
jgi:hypothetical protein